MVMLHNGADHTTIAMHDQPTRKPLSRSVNRVNVRDVAKVERAILHMADENAFTETTHGQNIGEVLLLQLRASGS